MRGATLALLGSFILTGMTAAEEASVKGSAALAVAGVVAPASSLLSAAEKRAVGTLFAGNANISYPRTIAVKADKIVCRTSNVDLTARSCELTFGKTIKTINGRAANEVYATEALAGVPSDGATGSILESLSKLSCTLDPKAIAGKDGSGATCSFELEN